jgi:hypothetical protein
VPIRSIKAAAQGERIAPTCWRWSRKTATCAFGYAATDEQIRRYVEQLNFERDELLGIFNRRLELIAMAHLAFSTDPRASAAPSSACRWRAARAAGLWQPLFERAVMHARNEGVRCCSSMR